MDSFVFTAIFTITDLLEDTEKLKLLKLRLIFFRRNIMYFRIINRESKLTIHLDPCKISRHNCRIPVFIKHFSSFIRLYLINILNSSFNCMIFAYNFLGCFRSDARYTRNIIGCIAHKPLHFYKFRRCYTVKLLNAVSIIIFNCCFTGLCLRYPDKNLICCKLKQIAVTWKYSNLISFFICFSGKCTDNIISFITALLNGSDAHEPQKLLNHRKLFAKFIIHAFSCTLIFWIHKVPECRLMNIKSNGYVSRLFLIIYLVKNI